MRKTYGNGEWVEGTPEEIREYDQARAVTVIPMAPAERWTPPMPMTCETWATGKVFRNVPPRCLIQDFFRANPTATSCMISCPCGRCTSTCLSN